MRWKILAKHTQKGLKAGEVRDEATHNLGLDTVVRGYR